MLTEEDGGTIIINLYPNAIKGLFQTRCQLLMTRDQTIRAGASMSELHSV